MEASQKLEVLHFLNTKEVIARIEVLEAQYEAALFDDLSYRASNSSYLASGSSDCSEVKRILAELAPKAQGSNQTQRDAWLTNQRKHDSALKNAIQCQHDTFFATETNRINIEMSKSKLQTMRAVLALKTAQIEFLIER